MDTLTRKGWSQPTLAALGVSLDGDRWVIPTEAGLLRYADDGRKPKMLATGGSTRALWPSPESVTSPILVVVEGEPDAISATELGYPTVALPGAGKFDPSWPARLVAGRRRVVLIGDCDETGRARMRSVAEQVTKYGGNAYVIDLDPGRSDGYDLGDLLVALGPAQARVMLDDAIVNASLFIPDVPGEVVEVAKSGPQRGIEVVNLASITPTRQAFLWYPYLPLGRVVIVAGAPGHGKSQLSAYIAGRTSRGTFEDDVTAPARVLMLCAEDDLSTTVVPRLLATNADVRNVDTINVITEHEGLTVKGMIRLPTDAGIVHAWVKSHPDARLIVLDPVASFFDRSHNMLVNQDSRDALGPLVSIAETYGVTVVIILHLNKSETKDFANRIAESHGFQALARSVIALGPHPDDEERERGSRKVFALTKANLVKPGNHAVECKVQTATLSAYTPPIETSELVIVGDCKIDAETLLLSASERTARVEAGAWLAEFFEEDDWRKSADVRKAAITDGHSWRTVERLARELGYQRAKQPGIQHGPWWTGSPNSDIRAIPTPGTLEVLDSQGSQGTQDSQGSKALLPFETAQGTQESRRVVPRERDLGAYREFERRKLGEGD